jgi:hypothetical protein
LLRHWVEIGEESLRRKPAKNQTMGYPEREYDRAWATRWKNDSFHRRHRKGYRELDFS